MNLEGLEQRIKRLEDRCALTDLNTRYFLAADADNLNGVADSFTEDATFATSGQICGRGRQAIVNFIAEARTHMGLTVHTPHYGLFTFRDDVNADGMVGAHLELVLAGQATYGAVRYADEYRQENGSWRIASRDMRIIYMGEWARVSEVFASTTPVQWPGAEAAASDFSRPT